MLFYGKLRKCREFLYSEELSNKDRLFFDSWYNRCHNSNSLMPFLNKRQNHKIWAFVIIANNQCYVGLTSNSQDLSGRKFPFTCFDIVTNISHNKDKCHHYICYYIQQVINFNALVQGGRLPQQNLDIFDSDNTTITENITLPSEVNTFIDMIDNADRSCWIDTKNNYIISYQNSLTCSLYNKIYG